MRPHYSVLRKCVVLAIIPLTLLSGRSSGGCVCLDGHFRLFCGGKRCCTPSDDLSRSDKSDASSHICCHAKSDGHPANHSCCRIHDGSIVGQTSQSVSSICCRQVELAPMLAAPSLSVQTEAKVLACDIPMPRTLVDVSLDRDVVCSEIQIKPSVDRLALLQRFLI